MSFVQKNSLKQPIATVKKVADVEADDLIMDIGPETASQYAELLKSAGNYRLEWSCRCI